MTDEEFKALEEAYFNESQRRADIQTLENKINKAKNTLECGLHEDGYESIVSMSLILEKSVYEQPQLDTYLLIIDDKEFFKSLVLQYLDHMNKKLASIKENV